jgi:hypothetical protein
MRQNEHGIWYISWSDKYTFGFQVMPIFRNPNLAQTITKWENTSGFDINKYFNTKVYKKYNYSEEEEELENLKREYNDSTGDRKLGNILRKLGGKGDYELGSTTNSAEYPDIIYMMLMDFMRYKLGTLHSDIKKTIWKNGLDKDTACEKLTDNEIITILFHRIPRAEKQNAYEVWMNWLRRTPVKNFFPPSKGGKRGKPRRKTRQKPRRKPRRKTRRKTRRKPRRKPRKIK